MQRASVTSLPRPQRAGNHPRTDVDRAFDGAMDTQAAVLEARDGLQPYATLDAEMDDHQDHAYAYLEAVATTSSDAKARAFVRTALRYLAMAEAVEDRITESVRRGQGATWRAHQHARTTLGHLEGALQRERVQRREGA